MRCASLVGGNLKARQAALHSFLHDPDCKVLLLLKSTTGGAAGGRPRAYWFNLKGRGTCQPTYFRMLGQRPDMGSPHSLRLSPVGGNNTVRCLGHAVAPRAAGAGFSGTRESLVLTVALLPWPGRFHALDRTIWPAMGSIYTPFTALPLPSPLKA